MSTFVVSLAFVLIAVARYGQPPKVAMAVATRGLTSTHFPQYMAMARQMTQPVSDPADSDPSPGDHQGERWWSTIGFGSRDPEEPVVGPAAMVQWWERLRSAVGLIVLVTLLGFAMAAMVGGLVFFIGFLLEQAVS